MHLPARGMGTAWAHTLKTLLVSAKGGASCASSMAVMATPQMSTLKSYLPSSPIWPSVSGAIQCGVPIIVPRLDMVLYSCAATPRSASLTLASAVSSTLAALMSRWIALRSVCM
jgi:hypothetical protein